MFVRTRGILLKLQENKEELYSVFINNRNELVEVKGIQGWEYGEVVAKSENIEELFERIVVVSQINFAKRVYTMKEFVKRVKRSHTHISGHDTYEDRLKRLLDYNEIYGAIWTEDGLTYMAKMTENRDWRLRHTCCPQ